MEGRRWTLIAFIAALCLCGAIFAVEEEVQDFDFPESEKEARVVVKRAAEVESDDEDFLNDDPGSGPDEGSGEPPVSELPPFESRFYRVELIVPGLEYSAALANRESRAFETMAGQLATVIELALSGEPAQYQVTVVLIEQARTIGSKVTLDMIVQGQVTDQEVEKVWRRLLSGELQTEPYVLSQDDFSIRRLQGHSQCPEYVGREPDQLPRAGENWAHLLINNVFLCNGSVVAWQYYRLVPQGSAFVGVWRLDANGNFLLLHTTELPPAGVGYQEVILERPISVVSQDFIGIYYSRSVPNNLVAQTTLDDDLLGPNELYQVFRVQIYEDELFEGQSFSIDRMNYKSANATFALRAVMEYTERATPVPPAYTCPSDQFNCGAGFCIKNEYRCDGQIDCHIDIDERDCTSCAEGLFLCAAEGKCIGDYLICDGSANCQDGSDEANCVPFSCSASEFQCRSGDCIPADLRCNTVEDCFDGSDEEGCKRECTSNEFRCNDGTCIDLALRCDSRPDCINSEDELQCTVECNPQTEFACADKKQCIPKEEKCNNAFDCNDFSDELPDLCLPLIPTGPPPCPETNFRCPSGICIERRRLCDRVPDCLDGSDEFNCEPVCTENQFQCNNGECIDAINQCDGYPNCQDMSDEDSRCPTGCLPSEFTCDNLRCVSSTARCNGFDDCGDRSDEAGCAPVCDAQREFACDNQCIDARLVCDGRANCRDRTDEANCAPVSTVTKCPETQFQCNSTGNCIDLSLKCDTNPDCSDASDEVDCPPTCGQGEFTCDDGTCISSSQQCDRQRDCRNGEDERSCPCREGEFTCVSDGYCLPPGYRCNRSPDCQDGSDELNCPTRLARISISPQTMRKRVGTSASFVCLVDGDDNPRIEWSRRTGGAMPRQAQIAGGRLTIVNLRPEDSGDYRCTLITPSGPSIADARLSVEFVGPVTVAPDVDGPCGRDESACSNGQCIPRDYVCDGEADCSDGSDERSCSVSLPCEPNEFRCDNGRCAVKIWRCDGDDDCLDNSDERNCPARQPGEFCNSDEFTCASGDQCVPLSYQCDEEMDCLDRSDEIGCIKPTIRTPPVPEIIVEVNKTFSIICEAIGTPTPLIVWRLNWGNIPSGPRVTVTSFNGRGVLTVRNARIEDAGAYTCEALNNRGSIFAVPDALIIVRRTQGICPSSSFNAEATAPEDCVRCFCFGQAQTCLSSNLQYSQITLGNTVALVQRKTLEPAEPSLIQYIPVSREFQVTDYNTVLRQGSYYWSLPYQYLTKKISSYGGELTYQVYYEVDGFTMPTDEPDVIITGNGMTIYHKSRSEFRPRAATTVRVNLVESQWEKNSDPLRGGPISEYSSREDMMMVLENVTSLLIRASYDNRQTLIRLGNVLLTTGVPQTTGRGRAVFVEECQCPTGYAGYSCENCAAGFYRVDRGIYGRECVACNCHGHSNECDPVSGECRICRDNTRGPNCNECAPGYVGNARSGRPDACQLCPCPLTNPENQFSSTCILDLDGDVTCTSCPVGYEGRQCERCADGYTGNPSIRGERCVIKTVESRCDNRGSLSTLTDPITDRCDCKANVRGRFCNECAPDTFYLSEVFPKGCISCFCMGVTQTCQSTAYNRAQVTLMFRDTPEGVTLSDMTRKQTVGTGFVVNPNSRELVYRSFFTIDSGLHYWSLPRQFLGDKVTAYGGNLRFTIRYNPGRDTSPLPPQDPIVEIGGNDITLVYRSSERFQANQPVSFSIPMIETRWVRMDGEPATRAHMLMTLADLEFIHIRAAYTTDTEEAAISAISLDIAENRVTGQERAYAVEQCVCPRGFKGLSCEDCDIGYTRTGGGLYLGLCEPCQCNGHSSECDPETGVCRNCRHNTVGDKCDRCARGYYGDAAFGTDRDCQRCPCPLTNSPNQFSPDCRLEGDGQVTCTACPVGHVGRRCESCATNYVGNPMLPGDYCRPINTTCECDGRGALPNVPCDPGTQQCQCKNNVQGIRCSSCRPGYFNLNQENPDGCLRCFCNGITGQCRSSNYYRSEISPQLNADGTHTFELTTRRQDRRITNGFTIDAARNEITFFNLDVEQKPRESLFINLPRRFRGDKVSSYGGVLRFSLVYTKAEGGSYFDDVDVEIISGRDKIYHILRPSPEPDFTNTYEILLTEESFSTSVPSIGAPSREKFMTILSDIDALLIRATFYPNTTSVTLRDLRMEIAVPGPTGLRSTPEVESCECPEGYTGLSCQACAVGYSQYTDPSTGFTRCTRCQCNGHASSCDPITGECRNCLHNTIGERCDKCIPGFYGDPRVGTPGDCRPCSCPLTNSENRFSPTCYLNPADNLVTCDQCPQGYEGRNCERCAAGYIGDPQIRGDTCRRDDSQLPGVRINPEALSVSLGSRATFECIPSGSAPFDVVWTRLDNRPLPGKTHQSFGPRYQLTIPSLQYSDSGRYVCTVTNAFGTNRGIASLRVETATPIRIRIKEPTQVKQPRGSVVRMVCEAVQTNDDSFVLTWTKENGVMPTKALDQGGVLTIPNLQESDAGKYSCTGSDPTGLDRADAYITVEDDFPTPPRVRIDPRYIRADVGQTGELRCSAENDPNAVITWFKGENGPLPSHIFTDETGLFRIDSVSRDDEGDYYCKATNEGGTTSVRTLILINRNTEPLRIVVREANLTAVVGETRRLECYVEGGRGSDVNLAWARERGTLPLRANQRSGFLTITDIQESDAGVYICTGTSLSSGNRIGGVNGRLIVVGSTYESPTVRIEPSNVVVGTGQSATIECIVTGEPRPEITWTSRRGLTNNHQVNGNILRIIQATITDRDIYTCTASNIAGRAQASSMVDIERREAPRISVYPESSVTVRPGDRIEFMCRVESGLPRPSVTWTRVGGLPLSSRTEVTSDGVIKITSVTSEDQGEYLCTATNVVGTITATASLRVSGPPTIQITPGTRIVTLVGEVVNVECVAIGDPTPNVFWRSDQKRRSDVLPEQFDAVPGTAKLGFYRIKKTDSGRYICAAVNDQGRTEKAVDIIVNDPGTTEPGVSIEGPQELNSVLGQSVSLSCKATGLNNPRITWRRSGNLPLPAGHSVQGGTLYIPFLDEDDGGEYICFVSGTAGPTAVRMEFQSTITIFVTVTPAISVSPNRVTSRVGETVTLTCVVSRPGEVTIEWQRIGEVMSSNVRESNGVLEIRQVTAADAGRYRCVVQGEFGFKDAIAVVEVVAPPQITIEPPTTEAYPGNTVSFVCDVTGEASTVTIRWEKQQGQLPRQHEITQNIITLYNVQPEDSGRYVCIATNRNGVARDSAFLRVIDNDGTIAGPLVQRFIVGQRLELICVTSGDEITVTWTKSPGEISQEALFSSNRDGDHSLVINYAQESDTGSYTCNARNSVGAVNTVVRVIVEPESVSGKLPSIISDPGYYKTAALGSPTQLACSAAGDPQPRITWVREDGDLPEEHTIERDGNLFIPRVRIEDGGRYQCIASNLYGTTRSSPTTLATRALVPFFQQNPRSYMNYRPLNDVYLHLDILVSFRPETTDGLLLYNGQYESSSGDFVCFGLENQYPQFRYDVGSGPAVITGSRPLELNKWHTVQMKRDGKNGTMMVNDEPVYYGIAPGEHSGLDIAQPLFVGSVPDFNTLPRSASFRTGFVGSISEIKIKGVSLNLGQEAIEVLGVIEYDVCQDRPCGVNGVCLPANNRLGFVCECNKGFAGDRCQVRGERCYTGACGVGKCYNHPGPDGFSCICPMGKHGEKCANDVYITDPAFNKTSFISYAPLSENVMSMTITLNFKLRSLDDGIILYNAQTQDGTLDFIAIIIKGTYLEFRFNTGSGPVVLRSRQPLRINEWTSVIAERRHNEGTLIINSESPVKEQVDPNEANLFPRLPRGDVSGFVTGTTVGLNLQRPLYIGGVDPFETLNADTGTSEGFVGCVGELKIDDRMINLVSDGVNSLHIQDCADRSMCSRSLCQNGAVCIDKQPGVYKCQCRPGYTGENCQTEINICVTADPCRNGGQCVVIGQSHQCNCPVGFMGQDCEIAFEPGTSLSFAGDGYVEFINDVFRHRRSKIMEKIIIKIQTSEKNGLIFWHGQDAGDQKGKDYFALSLNDGYLEFSFELGSGPSLIKSDIPIDDGIEHTITITRLGREGTLLVDDGLSISGRSKGALQVLNVSGNIFIGGVPNFDKYTAGLFSQNFVGCIKSIRIEDNAETELPLSFSSSLERVGGINVQPCIE